MMKNKIKQIGLAAAIAAIAFTMAACGEEEQHFHRWGNYLITTNPGCTTEGVKTAVCKDDPSHTDTKPVDALGHNWTDWNVTTAPTASEKGQAKRNCQRTGCNETKTSEVSAIITNAADLETYLSDLTNNTADNPYVIALDIVSTNNIAETLKDASEKYVGLIIYSTDSSSPITSIGDSAFQNCTGLTSVTIPDGVTSIGIWAFSGCTSLTSVTIPDSVTSIGDRVFSLCRSLTSVTIPDSVTSIGNSAFSLCRSLTSVTIPDSVTSSIGQEAFSSCSSLTSITIGNSVESIGVFAFEGCENLASVIIPNSVVSIGKSAFVCISLASVTFEGTIASSDFAVDAFEGKGYYLGDLRAKYLAGGIGTYTRPNVDSETWTKQ